MMRLAEFLIPEKKAPEPYWKRRKREIQEAVAAEARKNFPGGKQSRS